MKKLAFLSSLLVVMGAVHAQDSTSDCFGANIPTTPVGEFKSLDIIGVAGVNDAVNLKFWRTSCDVIDDGESKVETELLMTVTPVASGASDLGCYGIRTKQSAKLDYEDLDDLPKFLTGATTFEVESSEFPADLDDLNDIDYSLGFSINLTCLSDQTIRQYNTGFDSLSGGEETAQVLSSTSGVWFDRTLNGLGFNIVDASNGLAFYYFGYDSDGTPLWLISSVAGPKTVTVGETYSIAASEPAANNGGSFNSAPTTADSGTESWGTVELTFTTCTTATAVMTGKDGSQTFNLTKLAANNLADCIL